MKVNIEYFKKDQKGNQIYHDKKPVTAVTTATLPLRIGYGSYNEPRKFLNAYNEFGRAIDADDVRNISACGELNIMD